MAVIGQKRSLTSNALRATYELQDAWHSCFKRSPTSANSCMNHAMHLLKIQFDRVFDVVQDPIKSYSYSTLFSFESGGKRYFSVSIAGKPRLENGMQIVAALLKNDDWQSLVGWKDLNTGQIYLPSRAHGMATLAKAAPLFLTCAAGFFHTCSYWFLAGCLLISVACFSVLHERWQVRRARIALERA